MDITLYITDIALVSVALWMIFASARKGFVLSVLELVSFLVSSLLAGKYCSGVANWFYDSFCNTAVVNYIQNKLPADIETLPLAQSLAAFFEQLPETLKSIAETAGIKIDELAASIASVDLTAEAVSTEIAQKVVEPVFSSLLSAIFFVILFIVFSAVLGVVIRFINKFFKLPVLKTANKLLGAALGAVKACVIVYVLCVLLGFLAELNAGNGFAQAVQGSRVVAYVTESFPYK